MTDSARHLMLPHTLACPAACDYCFGPHQGNDLISLQTLEVVKRW